MYDKKLPRPGIERGTFRPSVWRSPNWAIAALQVCYLSTQITERAIPSQQPPQTMVERRCAAPTTLAHLDDSAACRGRETAAHCERIPMCRKRSWAAGPFAVSVAAHVTQNDSGGVRGALSHRLRPLGHTVSAQALYSWGWFFMSLFDNRKGPNQHWEMRGGMI